MKDYVIITDSTTDLPASFIEENNLVVIPLEYLMDGKEYLNYPDHHEMDVKTFYDNMRNGIMSKTNQINSTRFYDTYKEYIEKGFDILSIIFSSALSGTYNSALIAQRQIVEEYPDSQVFVIDSKAACLGEGLLVYYAIQAKKNGMTIFDNADYCEKLSPNISHWFTVDDIDTLRRGGRLSLGKSIVAKTLKIKPVLYVSPEGKLIPRMNKIGRKNALKTLVDKLVDMHVKEKNEIIFISHGDCLEEANYVKKMIEERTGITNFLIGDIGPVIGSHSGPGTLAVFFVSNGR